MKLEHVRLVNFSLTLVGLIIFAALFLYVQFAPNNFDQKTRAFAISKIESKVDDSISGVAQSDTADRISDFAGRYSERLQKQVDEFRQSLDNGIDVFIADILAAACKLDCNRRAEAQLAVRAYYESTIARYGVALERIDEIVQGEYDEIMVELRTDLTIFSGSNALMLAFALFLSIFKGKAARHLLPISIAPTGTTILMIYWYIVGQDWVMTIIFSNYWGWVYAMMLSGISVLMIDIAANKARVTSLIFNTVGNAFGSGFSFAPC